MSEASDLITALVEEAEVSDDPYKLIKEAHRQLDLLLFQRIVDRQQWQPAAQAPLDNIRCLDCGRTPSDGIALYRFSIADPRWICEEHAPILSGFRVGQANKPKPEA